MQGVSLTGSERAGAAVAEIAGRHLKKVVLELGGSDPFILLSTDDLDATVEAAVAARLDNNGQSCNAAKRFIVHRRRCTSSSSRSSPPRSPAVDAGRPDVGRHRARPALLGRGRRAPEEQVDRAVAQGATLVAGGTRDGTFFPTHRAHRRHAGQRRLPRGVLRPGRRRLQGGLRGRGVALANDTPFGLGSYVFTTDPEQALRVADRIEAGMVFVNVVGADGAELPFGGVKRSGSGRELGRFGADEFVNKKMIRIG